MLDFFRNGASPLANAFGVGFIDWLDACVSSQIIGRRPSGLRKHEITD
jgi:hypothetical protein